MTGRRIASYAARIIALLFALTAILYVRILISSRAELDKGDQAQSPDEQLEHYGRSLRLYAPLNPYQTVALNKLGWACDWEHYCSGSACRDSPPDDGRMLAACREMRSALLAVRSIYQPYPWALERANARIARLSAKLESPAADPTTDEEGRRKWHLDRLSETYEPKLGWTLVALAGLATFLGSAVGFFYRGLDENDRLRGQAAVGFGIGIAVGFASLLVGLARA